MDMYFRNNVTIICGKRVYVSICLVLMMVTLFPKYVFAYKCIF